VHNGRALYVVNRAIRYTKYKPFDANSPSFFICFSQITIYSYILFFQVNYVLAVIFLHRQFNSTEHVRRTKPNSLFMYIFTLFIQITSDYLKYRIIWFKNYRTENTVEALKSVWMERQVQFERIDYWPCTDGTWQHPIRCLQSLLLRLLGSSKSINTTQLDHCRLQIYLLSNRCLPLLINRDRSVVSYWVTNLLYKSPVLILRTFFFKWTLAGFN